MHFDSFSFTTSFTDSLRPFEGLFSGWFPSNTITSRTSTFPAWMSIFNNKLRLPFCHALIIAKNFIGMKIASWSCYWFTTPITWLCNQIRSFWVFPALFSYLGTLPRTINLISFSCAYGWFPTHRTKVYFSIPPSVLEKTITGTKILIRTTIIWVKRVATVFANSSFGVFFHTYIINTIAKKSIEIEEKYCEIAVRRLAQEVLPFGSNQSLETDGQKDGHRLA